jgi:pilus assembly protein CpaE
VQRPAVVENSVASEPTAVLLICADRDSATRLAAAIAPRGHRVIAAPFGPTALAKAHAARLIIIDRVEGAADAVGAVTRLKGSSELATIPVLAIAQGDDVEERVRLLEAGADDVVSRPVDPLELQLRMDTLLVQPIETPADPVMALVPRPEPAARTGPAVLAFLSAKGGAGTTTAAVNVACALARSGRSVAIVDLHLTFGSVALHLDVVPRFSIVEAVRDDQALDDPEALRAYATMRDNLAIFSAPLTPDQAEMVTAEHVRQLLTMLSAAFDVTVVDVGSGFDERTVTVAGIADRLVLLSTPEIPALRAVRSLVGALAEYETDASRHIHVLNHLFPADMITREEVRAALGGVDMLELPYSQTAYHKAVVTGVPVVIGAPRSEPADRLTKLATQLMGGASLEPADGAKKLRLAGLLRRG